MPLRAMLPLVAALAGPTAQPARAAALDITVSPAEGGAGIAKALETARALRAKNPDASHPIRIVFKPGTYVLHEALQLTAKDSGTPASPLLLIAEKPGSVTLSGAMPMPLAEQGSSGWRFKPRGGISAADERGGGQFFIDGRRATLAREPDAPQWWFVGAPSKDVLRVPDPQKARLAELLEGQKDRAIISLMQSWTSGLHRAGGEDKNGVSLQPAPNWPMLKFGASQRFFVENVPKALDQPGEWLASDEEILYLPQEGDKARAAKDRESIHAFWPRFPTLLRIQGSDAKPVQHVRIQGLGFAYTGVPVPPKGWRDVQAAIDIPAAIEADHARHIALRDCEVAHTGGYAVWLRQDVQESEVSRCVMHDLGAGGIKLGEPTGRGGQATGKNRLKGNVVMETGKAYPGAVGIWIGRSGDNLVQQNLIGRTTYTGISVGWSWGYTPQGAERNRIEGNVLLNIGEGQLSDLGGIYTLGDSRGTVIRGNLIRQVRDYRPYGAGAWGIYNDEGSSGLDVDNNIIVGTRSGGYHLHYGKDVNVARNVFAQSDQAEVRWSDPNRSGPWRFGADNLSTSPDKDLDLNGAAAAPARQQMGVRGSGTVMGGIRAQAQRGAADVQIQAGKDVAPWWNEVLEQARRTVAEARRLPGFEPEWLVVADPPAAAAATARTTAAPASAHAVEWKWAITDLPPGPVPEGLKYEPRRVRDAVAVVDDGRDGGCLLLKDGLPDTVKFEPYVYASPGLPLPRVETVFEVRLDESSLLLHEWRDDSRPYKSLLKFTMSGGQGLVVNGVPLGRLPTGQWLRFKVATQPEGDGGMTWRLDLDNLATGTRRQWRDLNMLTMKKATEVAWIGWISDTTQASRACLRRIDMHPY